jgi:hypothetical protein
MPRRKTIEDTVDPMATANDEDESLLSQGVEIAAEIGMNW